MSVLTKEQVTIEQLLPEINANHRECIKSGNDALKHAIQAGELLVKLKECVKHGEFQPLIESRCDFSLTSAKTYIKIATDLPAVLKTSGKTAGADMTIRGGMKLIAEAKPQKASALTKSPTAADSNGKHANNKPPPSATPPAEAVDLGKCPNCGGKKWKDDGLGNVCAKCKHPHGEPAGDADDHRTQAIRDQQSKLVKTMEAGMRAVGDLYDLVRNDAKKAEANRLLKIVLHMGKDWLQ